MTFREEGHTSKECEKPLTEEFLATVTCRRCEQTGHLSADCPERPKLVCSNCDQDGHKSRDCPVVHLVDIAKNMQEPPNMDKVQCKECEEMGHFARDCPNKKCRNCDQTGHHSRECHVRSHLNNFQLGD